MGIRIEWDDDNKIAIRYTAEGRWTWDDFYQATNLSREMMDSVPHEQVDYIVDMSKGGFLPQNAMSQLGRVSRSRHAKAGRLVLVGTNAFIKALVNVMAKVNARSATNMYVVDTLDEARLVLAAHRGQLTSTL
jgi:hypothetical protein